MRPTVVQRELEDIQKSCSAKTVQLCFLFRNVPQEEQKAERLSMQVPFKAGIHIFLLLVF